MNDKLTEGSKFDIEKNRYDLLDPYSLDELTKVYTFGCRKYEEHNWRKGIKWSRIFGALMRHSWAFWKGEEIDPDSGLHHMAHAAWNCLTLINYSKYRKDFDDRYLENEFINTLSKSILPERWWEYHHPNCGTKWRGCDPTLCPKDKYENTGIWDLKLVSEINKLRKKEND